MLVYRGDVHMEDVSGLSSAFRAWDKLDEKQNQEALLLAEQAVQLAPGHLYTEWALGDAAAASGKKDEARAAYQAAKLDAQKLDAERQADFVKAIERSVSKL